MSATDLAATLRNERHRRGFTLAEVASMCEVGTPHISKIETGVEQPGVALLERLADWWRLDLVALLVLAGRVHPAIASALERGAAAEAVIAASSVDEGEDPYSKDAQWEAAMDTYRALTDGTLDRPPTSDAANGRNGRTSLLTGIWPSRAGEGTHDLTTDADALTEGKPT